MPVFSIYFKPLDHVSALEGEVSTTDDVYGVWSPSILISLDLLEQDRKTSYLQTLTDAQ